MERYEIYEGHMAAFRKKIATIRRKCERYGCELHFSEVGEVVKEVEDPTTTNPFTGKPVLRPCKFIVVEAEGTAVINGWEFVASVERTDKGNIFSKAMTDVEIPSRYYNAPLICEHCGTDRVRKSAFIVRESDTGDIKMVGHNCLMDYTRGMSASCAALAASFREIFEEAAEAPIGFGSGWRPKTIRTDDVLHYAAETIRAFGFSKSENGADSTRSRVLDFYRFFNGEMTSPFERDLRDHICRLIETVGFDANSEKANEMVAAALKWLDEQPEESDYIHNLKVVTALKYTDYSRFGLLVSLFPAYDRDLAREAARRAEAEQGRNSDYVGNVGDRIDVPVEAVKCVTSWECSFNGSRPQTTYLWKIVGSDGNVYMWKTSNWMDEDIPPISIKGTVKEHAEFRGVKQTTLTRCKCTERRRYR